jgi:hypothetical protein
MKITFWLAVEIVLTLLGIDDLADYSEFILNNKTDHSCQSLICDRSLISSYFTNF